MFFLYRAPVRLKMTHVNMIIRSSLIFHPIPMKFWLKTTNIIYKNWLNSHIDRIKLKISRNKNRHVAVKVPHPVDLYFSHNTEFSQYCHEEIFEC